ncbi:MAG: methylmalonyl-CoA mutase [Gammaproteobacteria bacterium]|nr:methylmalonyl-CoA mutase [Gammaproteobacteria bacterium]
MTEKKTRVLISKLGLDGHDRGAKLVAHALKEAGIKVFYQGIRHTINEVVDKAIQEQVEFIGMSFLAGDHMTIVPKVINELKQKQAGNIKIFIGGIILKEQIPELKSMGVQQVFLPGTPLKEIADYVKTHAAKQDL